MAKFGCILIMYALFVILISLVKPRNLNIVVVQDYFIIKYAGEILLLAAQNSIV